MKKAPLILAFLLVLAPAVFAQDSSCRIVGGSIEKWENAELLLRDFGFAISLGTVFVDDTTSLSTSHWGLFEALGEVNPKVEKRLALPELGDDDIAVVVDGILSLPKCNVARGVARTKGGPPQRAWWRYGECPTPKHLDSLFAMMNEASRRE